MLFRSQAKACQPRTLAHAGQAEAGRLPALRRIEPGPVVLDDHPEPALAGRDPDLHAALAGVGVDFAPPNTVCGRLARCAAAGLSGRYSAPFWPQPPTMADTASATPLTRMNRRGCANDMGAIVMTDSEFLDRA